MMNHLRKMWVQSLLFLLGVLVVLYAIIVLIYTSTSYEIGIRSILTPHSIGKPQSEKKSERSEELSSGDKIVKIGDLDIHTWADMLQAPAKIARRLQHLSSSRVPWLEIDPQSGQIFVLVEFERPDSGVVKQTWCELRRTPFEEMLPSIIWLFLKGALFVVGAFVYWKRPQDESALRFYLFCVVTVGAYVGGYHWAHIVTQPILILGFMVFAILLPVTSLHFYLVFPRKKSFLEQYPRQTLCWVYGPPLCNLIGIVCFYIYIKWIADTDYVLIHYFPWLIHLSFGVATLWYVASFVALLHSWLNVQDSMERKQIKCVMVGIGLSMIPIGFSLYIFFAEPEHFVSGALTWPMFFASTMVTLSFAIGMTRYRLMELDTLISSSLGYVLVSFFAGLMYYGVVFIGTLFYNRFVTHPTLPAALTVSTTALLFVLALDMARSRFKKALDRRFSRNKLQLDHTLQQMSEAVSQLVDPPLLSQRLLVTIADALSVHNGAVFLLQEEPATYRMAASLGEPPGIQDLPIHSPLVETMKSGLGLEIPARSEGTSSLAQSQLRQLGAEVAQPLMHNGTLLAILVLGTKETPYRAEDWTLLAAFAQITVVVLESAAQHRIIDQLHRELQSKVDKIAEQQRRILTLQTQLHRQTATEKVVHRIEAPVAPVAAAPGENPPAIKTGIVGSSPAVNQLLSVVRKVAATDAVVLLRGESGTGKELLARAVHETSPRHAKPYVKVHCAALSAYLLESELFGHVKGAFTGAHRDKVGRFELANGGTLFLDEIGDISLDVQTKLLRVLQERTFERVGSSETLHVDVRIIAATHQNLEKLIRQGRFREDLFYRLHVFPIQVPPLRERREDIPELVMYFVQQASQRCRKNLLHLEDEAMAALRGHSWPGNIRELENVIERAVVIAEGDTLRIQDLPEELVRGQMRPQEPSDNAEPEHVDGANLEVGNFRTDRDSFEREQLVRALKTAGGNKAEAARILGVARTTLASRMKKLGVV